MTNSVGKVLVPNRREVALTQVSCLFPVVQCSLHLFKPVRRFHQKPFHNKNEQQLTERNKNVQFNRSMNSLNG